MADDGSRSGVTAAAGAASSGEEPPSAFAAALRLNEEGDFDGALHAFQQAIDEEPQKAADAAYNIAAVQHMLGRTREAVKFAAMVRCQAGHCCTCMTTSVYVNPHQPQPQPHVRR